MLGTSPLPAPFTPHSHSLCEKSTTPEGPKQQHSTLSLRVFLSVLDRGHTMRIYYGPVCPSNPPLSPLSSSLATLSPYPSPLTPPPLLSFASRYSDAPHLCGTPEVQERLKNGHKTDPLRFPFLSNKGHIYEYHDERTLQPKKKRDLTPNTCTEVN